MFAALLYSLPWLLLPLLAAVFVRRRPRLDECPPVADEDPPPVTVIVPARNEAHNVGDCVSGLLASAYPRLRVIVVDDASGDGTAAVALAAGKGDRRLLVIDAGPLPAGWFGKP